MWRLAAQTPLPIDANARRHFESWAPRQTPVRNALWLSEEGDGSWRLHVATFDFTHPRLPCGGVWAKRNEAIVAAADLAAWSEGVRRLKRYAFKSARHVVNQYFYEIRDSRQVVLWFGAARITRGFELTIQLPTERTSTPAHIFIAESSDYETLHALDLGVRRMSYLTRGYYEPADDLGVSHANKS